MGESLQWLKKQVDSIEYDEMMFRIAVGDDKYIFGAILGKNTKENKPDFFALSSIYDTIVDVNHKIKYSFYMAAECEPSESLKDYSPLETISTAENTAIYFIENMVFRTSILWDMIAQMCNVFWLINKPNTEIYVAQFFHDMAQGKKAKPLAVDIYSYLKEANVIKGDKEYWNGNHQYIKDYRDKMTHRNSPNISTMSSFAMELRPPAMFVLKRVTEDYLKASEFIKIILDEISAEFSDFSLFSNYEEEPNV